MSAMIEDYNTALGILQDITESCMGDEKDFVESAIKSIHEAKMVAIEDKKNATEELMESGEISIEEYNNFTSYMEAEELESTLILEPYMTEAALSMSAALSASEARAFKSPKYENINKIAVGTTFGSSERSFIQSRLNKLASLEKLAVKPNKLKKKAGENGTVKFSYNGKDVITVTVKDNGNKKSLSVSATDGFTDSIYDAYVSAACGVMTNSIKSELSSAKNKWEMSKKGSEKAIKEYVEDIIEESGDTTIIREHLKEGIESGKINHFAARFFTRISDAMEMRNFTRRH